LGGRPGFGRGAAVTLVLVIEQRGPGGDFSVLLVCTGNICRSALAQQLGRAYLADVPGEEAGGITLTSAGTHAVVDAEMHPDSALVLRDLGGDPDGFRARQLQQEHPSAADLVLTMTREHRRQVLELAPRTLSRTFTLREAADLVALLDGHEPRGSDFAARARRLVSDMAEARARRRSRDDDDVVDPINQPLEVHRHAGELIAAALPAVLDGFVALRAARPRREVA
jgi:protein-tyrosine phosphatase